jgi:hypothetical protein
MAFKAAVRLDVEVNGGTFSRDGRQLLLICRDITLRIFSVPDAQLIKVIHLVGDHQGTFKHAGITADGCQVVCLEHALNLPRMIQSVRLWDIHGDGSAFEDVIVYEEGD